MLFVILGSITLVAVLYGLIAAWRTRRALAAMHLVALVLVILAWSLGHIDLMGRMALAVAMLLEVIAWLGIRHDAPARSIVPFERSGGGMSMYAAEPIYETDIPATAEPIYDDAHPEPMVYDAGAALATESESSGAASRAVYAAEPANEMDSPPHVDEAPAEREEFPAVASESKVETTRMPTLQQRAGTEICIRTFALLARPYHVTLSVLLASMKRAGLRHARLIEPESAAAPSYIEVDGLKIGLDVIEEPVAGRRIETAVEQSGLDDDAVEAVRSHEAQIAVDVAYDRQTARTDAVLTAMRAHAALMEFAPVIAVYWPEAAGIIPAGDSARHVAAGHDDAVALTETCVSQRRFTLDGPNAGLLVLDSIGLSAFGLPDAQVVVSEADQDRGVAALRELSSHFLLQGCDLPDGGHHALADGSYWRVSYTRSAFDPDREVVQIRPDAGGAAVNAPDDGQCEDSDSA